MNTIEKRDDDIQKIEKLNALAWQTRVSDSLTAEKISRQAFELAATIGYSRGLAEGYRTYAFTLIRQSKLQEALSYCQQALDIFIEIRHIQGQASIYEYFGIIERSRGNLSASLDYLLKGILLSEQACDDELRSLAHYHAGVTYKYLGQFEQALQQLMEGLRIATEINNWISRSYCINLIGQIYFETGDYANALDYYEQSLQIRKESGDRWGEAGCLDNIGLIHMELKAYEKASICFEQSLSITQSTGHKKGEGNTLYHLGIITMQLGDYSKARQYADRSMQIRKETGDIKGEAEILLFMAELELTATDDKQTSIFAIDFLTNAMQLATQTGSLDLIAKIHFGFYEKYKQLPNYSLALEHLEKYMELSRQIHTDALNRQIQNLEISHRVEKSRQEAEIYKLRNIELANLYQQSEKQKDEIAVQKLNVENTLSDLKEAQEQLIQREKMASLGELTAGIAHEIQNPLNFVNNFSEINKEMIAEMNEEIVKGNYDEVRLIANNLAANEEKINHHGKRADAIVKGMLQHSRASTGKKELTDINALADEYLRLSYHGLRAKDKEFNANFITHFDESIGTINVVPQDIGRVLLNLYNNAFYAASLPSKASPDEPVGRGGFKDNPTIWVSTKAEEDKVLIRVKDNGPGIPRNIVDKIFQPFFTTKPTGQGTGLGLSLSYDIIKAHGGDIKVNSKEGEGTQFIIQLPLT